MQENEVLCFWFSILAFYSILHNAIIADIVINIKQKKMIYKVTICHNNGKRQILKDDDFDFGGLLRAVEKCEIKSFSVALAPIK